MNQDAPLSGEQLRIILDAAPLLSAVERELGSRQNSPLLNLELQVSEAFASGKWDVGGGQTVEGPECSHWPTVGEAHNIFSEACLDTPHAKSKIDMAKLIQSLGMVPPVLVEADMHREHGTQHL